MAVTDWPGAILCQSWDITRTISFAQFFISNLTIPDFQRLQQLRQTCLGKPHWRSCAQVNAGSAGLLAQLLRDALASNPARPQEPPAACGSGGWDVTAAAAHGSASGQQVGSAQPVTGSGSSGQTGAAASGPAGLVSVEDAGLGRDGTRVPRISLLTYNVWWELPHM